MPSILAEIDVASSAITISACGDQDSIVSLVRGKNLSVESARTELALCSLDRFKREFVVALPTPTKEYWWTTRLRIENPSISLAVPESIALAAGLIADNHAPDGWTCGVLTAGDSAYYLSLFSSDGIFGRIAIQSPSLARLGIDLRQALISSLPLSISSPSAAGCDALYVPEDFPGRDAAALAETLQILVERCPTDRSALANAGREFLGSEISRLCA